MYKLKNKLSYFTKFELALWVFSAFVIVLAFILFDRGNYLNLFASIIGITALIFCAKGNPLGQFLIIIFACLYGYVSFNNAYYGEMITYLGMSAPMAVYALITWLRNPYNGNKSEVKVNKISLKEILFMFLLSLAVTFTFYFLLKHFNTANLIPSTVSVTTSFIAVYLSARRSPFYALAYALNDVILIILWVLATIKDINNISVIMCFIVFLINDLYGFVNWLKMQKRQAN